MSNANAIYPQALLNLVKCEQSVITLPICDPVEVFLLDRGRQIEIRHRGNEYYAQLDRPIIHRIGSRLWGDLHNYETIARMWEDRMQADQQSFENEIAQTFQRAELIIKYVPKNGGNRIYGIVTSRFVYSNQLEFRDCFLQAAQDLNLLNVVSSKSEVTKFGEIVEYFDLYSYERHTKYKYGLVYAKNNGYDAYNVKWKRIISVCSNGLTTYENVNAKWIHDGSVPIDTFIRQTVEEGVRQQQLLEGRIEASIETALDRTLLAEFMNRIHIAPASKPRITDRLRSEVRAVGNTEWALSQALTWLGSHEKALDFRPRRLLTEAGTEILEHSLDKYLNEDHVYTTRDGYLGALLPRKHVRN